MFHWLTLQYTGTLHGCPFAFSWWTNSCPSFLPSHWWQMAASVFCPEQPFCRTNWINLLGNLNLDTLAETVPLYLPPPPKYYFHLFIFPVVQDDDVPQGTPQDLLFLQPPEHTHTHTHRQTMSHSSTSH